MYKKNRKIDVIVCLYNSHAVMSKCRVDSAVICFKTATLTLCFETKYPRFKTSQDSHGSDHISKALARHKISENMTQLVVYMILELAELMRPNMKATPV